MLIKGLIVVSTLYFLTKSTLFYLGFFNFFVWFFIGFKAAFITLFFSFIVLFFFRQKKNPMVDENIFKQNIHLAPATGKVTAITTGVSHSLFGNKLTKIEIDIYPLEEGGLRIPNQSQIIDIKFIKKNLKGIHDDFIDTKLMQILFKSHTGEIFGIEIAGNIFGFMPKIWIRTGDQGFVGAAFGLNLWRENVEFYFPDNFDVFVKTGEELIAAFTPICGIKKKVSNDD
jgi:hypothetical protein